MDRTKTFLAYTSNNLKTYLRINIWSIIKTIPFKFVKKAYSILHTKRHRLILYNNIQFDNDNDQFPQKSMYNKKKKKSKFKRYVFSFFAGRNNIIRRLKYSKSE